MERAIAEQCDTVTSVLVMLCPLCGGKRHRKSGDTFTECAWRQFARDEALLNEYGEVPDVSDWSLLHRYADWMKDNLHEEHSYMGRVFPSLLAGSTAANRLLRMQARGDL